MPRIGPEELLKAYAAGIFPMARSARARDIFWVEPEERGILPLDQFHIPKRLTRTVRQDVFRVRINTAFERVMTLCAEAAPDRPATWINAKIRGLYSELHARGHAHSVEAWAEGELKGGLYGVSLGTAFFGESMFARVRDASKVALVHLVAHLKRKGFALLDTQFITPHLKQFGAIEISREDYRVRLSGCLASSSLGAGVFGAEPKSISGVEALQSISQTS
jgi:leucyl/phenylalanyl-tRNA--protein transferase